MRNLLCLLAFCMLLASARAELSELKVWLEPTVCLPGDIVKLHAEFSSPDFAEFELKIPKHDSLHFVDQHSLPADYDGSLYIQKTIWTLQSVADGTVELSDIVAIVHQDGAFNEHTLATQTLKVRAYDSIEDDNTPLPLPAATIHAEDTKNLGTLFALLIFSSAAIIFAIMRRYRRRAIAHLPEEKRPSIEDLKHELGDGEIPTAMIESILSDTTIQLSEDLRKLFEQVTYHTNKETSTNDLIAALEGEHKP